jgi:hypothetical protein
MQLPEFAEKCAGLARLFDSQRFRVTMHLGLANALSLSGQPTALRGSTMLLPVLIESAQASLNLAKEELQCPPAIMDALAASL